LQTKNLVALLVHVLESKDSRPNQIPTNCKFVLWSAT
jgi:hypothetical protein